MKNPLVELAADGTILRVERCEAPDRLPQTEFYAGALLPGLVNAHCHLELSYLLGAIPAGRGFAAFASAMGRVRHNFTLEERIRAARTADAQFHHEGVVAVGDVANDRFAFEVKNNSPIHYHTFAEVFGLRTRDCSHQEPLLNEPSTSLTPHSIYSLQDDLFRSICRQGEKPLSIHFLESEAENELYQGRGRLWEWYKTMGFQCDFLHYGSPTERLIASIPKERSVILVHNCALKQEEIDRIMSHFTAPVSWCLCPGSNDYISHLAPPVELLRRNGLEICIGTDSAASNHSLSMLEEVRHLQGIPLSEQLLWATLGGARALKLDHMLGSIEVGKRPGLVLLEGVDWQQMELTERSTMRRIG